MVDRVQFGPLRRNQLSIGSKGAIDIARIDIISVSLARQLNPRLLVSQNVAVPVEGVIHFNI